MSNLKKKNKPLSASQYLSIALLAGCAMFANAQEGYADEVADYNNSYTSNLSDNEIVVSKSKIKGVPTGFAVPSSPTRGSDAGYTIGSSGTIPILTYNINSATGAVISSQTQYANIKATTYSQGSLSYSWDNSTHRLTASNSGSSVKLPDSGTSLSGEEVGNSSPFYPGDDRGRDLIQGLFVNNNGYDGGSIDTEGAASLGRIVGTFIGNNAETGTGAIHLSSHTSSVDSIEGDFIGNYGGYAGGLSIHATNGVGTVTGDFIGNDSTKNGEGQGGALRIKTSLGLAVGNFLNNKSNDGGAVHNSGTAAIAGNFFGNTATANGGAIWNEGNLTVTTSGANTYFAGNTANGSANDVYNIGNLYLSPASGYIIAFNDPITGSGNTTVNNSGAVYFHSSVAQGGLTISNGTVYATLGNLSGVSTLTNNSALYTSGTLNKNIGGSGTTVLNGGMTWSSGSIGGTFNPNGYGIGGIQNSSIGTYNVGKWAGNSSVAIDVNSSNRTADKFYASTRSGNSGTLSITSINDIGTKPTTTGTYVYTVLDAPGASIYVPDSIKNAWTYNNSHTTPKVADTINATTAWTDTYYNRWSVIVDEGALSTSGGNLVYTIASSTTPKTEKLGDTLYLVNTATNNATKNFNAPAANSTYTVGTNIGSTYGTVNVNGVGNVGNQSTINFGSYSGFSIGNGRTVNLNNVKTTNGSSFLADVASGGKINISNSEIAGQGIKTVSGANIGLTGTNTISGAISGAGTTSVTSGTTTLNAALAQATLSVSSGAALNINSGKTATVSSTLSNAGTIGNSGTLNITGATENAGTINGSGKLDLDNNFTNKGTISQGTIDIASGKTLTNNSGKSVTATTTLTNSGEIVNNGSLTIQGTNNTGKISGSGTTYVRGQITNNSTITQGTVDINSGNKLTSNGAITAAVSNAGTFDNNAALTGKLTNSGTAYSAANNLQNVTNTGTLHLEGNTYGYTIDGAGTLILDANTTNNGTITQGTLNTNGKTLTNNSGKSVTVTSTLTNSGVIANAGTLNINGATSNAGTINGTGTLNVNQNFENAGTITQNTVSIASGKTLTNDANKTITVNTALSNAGTITNNGTLKLTGSNMTNAGTINDASTRTGTTEISGNLNNTGTITQKEIKVTGKLTSNASNLSASSGLTNTGTLNLTGGTNSNTITGSTGTTNFSGTTTNNGEITQASVTNSGTLTNNAKITAAISNSGTLSTNASYINGDVANTNNLTLTGGTLNKKVSGTGGTTHITGEVTGNALISQAIDITTAGNFITNANNVGGNVTNNGTLTLNGGTLSYAVSGNGGISVTGTVTNEAVVSQKVTITDTGNLTNNNKIGNVINNGILTSTGENLTGTIQNNKTLNLSGTLAKAVSGNGTTYVANALTFKNGADVENILNLSTGATLTVDGGTGSNYAIGTLTGNGIVDVKNGTLTIDNDATLNSIDNKGTTNIGGKLTAVNGVVNSGTLTTTGKTSAKSLTNSGSATVGGDLTITDNVSNTNSLTVNGHLKATDVTNSGSLTVKQGAEVRDLTNNGTTTITGRLDARDVTNNGNKVFKVNGSAFVTNVTNHGDMDITGNLVVANTIRNTGDLDVFGTATAINVDNIGNFNVHHSADVTLVGDLTSTDNITTSGILDVIGTVTGKDLLNRGQLSIGNGANLNGLTNTADATINMTKDLVVTGVIAGDTNSNGVVNNGIIDVNGNVNITNNLANNNKLVVSKNLTAKNINTSNIMEVTGDVSTTNLTNTGNAEIDGKLTTTENVSNTKTMTVDGKVTAQDVTNSGTMTLNGGAQVRDLTNTKTANITGNVTADDVLNTDDMDIAGNLTATGNITNQGAASDLNITGHVKAKDTTNSGTLTISNGAELEDIENDGTATIIGDVSASTITNTDTISVTGNVNSDKVTNSGSISVTKNLISTNDIINQGAASSLTVNGNVSGVNLSNAGTVDIDGTLTTSENVSNTKTMTVDGKVTAQDVTNSGTMTLNGGAQVRDLTNTKTANITGNVTADDVLNTDDMDITGNLTATGNITNQGVTSDLNVTGSVSGVNVTNQGTTKIGGDLTASEDINNSKSFTVEGHTTANNVMNTDTLTLKDGANLHDLTNSKSATIINGLSANKITNTDTVNIEKGVSSVATIDNTATINIKEADNFTLTTGINGNTKGTVNIDKSNFETNGNIRNQDVKATDSALTFGDNGDVLKNSTLSVNNTTVNLNDGVYTNYTMDKLDSSLNSRYVIDIFMDKDEQKSDTFTLTQGGSGYIYIKNINVGGNIINNCDDNERHILQIIKSSVPDAPQLTYDESKVLNQATANMTSDIIFAKDFGLRTTNTLNDTLEIRGWMDTFREWAINDRGEFNRDEMKYEFPSDKTFTFVDDTTVKLTKDIDEFVGNNFVINGADNIYDVDGHEFLKTINNDQTITFKDIDIINNNSNPTENNGILNLENVSYDKDIKNNNELHLTGKVTLADIENNGTMDFNGTVLTYDNITNNDDVDVTGDMTVNNDLDNNKNFDVTGDVEIGHDLNNNDDGELNIDGTLDVTNDINNSGSMAVTGDTTVDNEIKNTGEIEIGGDLEVQKGITNTGNDSELDVDGDVNITNGSFSNDGDTTIGGNLDVSNNITNSGNIDVDKNVTVTNDFTSNGTETDPGSTKIGGDLEVGGNINISDSDKLEVDGDTTVDKKFINDGDVKIGGNLDVKDEILISGDTEVEKDVTVTNDFTSNGTDTNPGSTKIGGDLEVGGNINISDSDKLEVDGDTTVDKKFINDGDVKIGGNLEVKDEILISGDTEVEKDVTVTNDFTSNGTETNPGSTKIGGDLEVGGNINISDSDKLEVDGDTTVDKKFINDGDVKIGGNLDVKDEILISGDTEVEKDVTVTNDFTSNGTDTNPGSTKIGGDLEVGGNINISDSDKLEVDGDTTVDKKFINDGDVKIGGNLDVKDEIINAGVADIDGHVTTIDITNDGTLIIGGGTEFKDMVNTGDVDITGDTTANTITNNGGDIDIVGTVKLDEITNTGDITITGNTNVPTIDNSGTLTVNDSKFNFDTISSTTRGDLNLNNVKTTLNGTITNQNITVDDNSVINIPKPYNLINDSLSISNSVMNISDLTLQPLHFNQFELGTGGTININSSQVDFRTETMGRITADDYLQAGANSTLNLYNINMLNVPHKEQDIIRIPFADNTFRESVKYHGTDEVYSAIYKYGIGYNKFDGKMYFVRGGWLNPDTGKIEYPRNPAKRFNPAIMASSVASQAGAVATMNQAFVYAFQNSDNFMGYSLANRMAMINRNKYAISETSVIDGANPTFEAQENSSIWVKPYATFETVPLRDGPKVHNNIWGTMIGFDTDLKTVKNGWARAITTYLGYNGASQRYGGVDLTQNGVLAGSTLTFYKNNWFNATTLSAGFSFSESESMYGHDNSKMLLAGIGNKTGYNFEFKDGRFIIQPNLLLAYTFVNTFDYTNAAGLRVHSKPLHSIQVSPNVKFIMNTKRGWQPYVTAGMVWNFHDRQKVRVDYTVDLPATSVRPYFQYGIGVQKVIKDRFMGFGQIMLSHGGRNGVSMTVGFRWNLGGRKSKNKHDKVKNVQNIQQQTDIKEQQNLIPAIQVDTNNEIRPIDNSVLENTNTQNLNGYTADIIPVVQTTESAIDNEKSMAEILPKIEAKTPMAQPEQQTFVQPEIRPADKTSTQPEQLVLPPVTQTIAPNEVQTVELVKDAETVSRSVVNKVQTDKPLNYANISDPTMKNTRKLVERERNIKRYFALIDDEE